ncbi:hypothetical protein YC2023_084968 [Brassica napus]
MVGCSITSIISFFINRTICMEVKLPPVGQGLKALHVGSSLETRLLYACHVSKLNETQRLLCVFRLGFIWAWCHASSCGPKTS